MPCGVLVFDPRPSSTRILGRGRQSTRPATLRAVEGVASRILKVGRGRAGIWVCLSRLPILGLGGPPKGPLPILGSPFGATVSLGPYCNPCGAQRVPWAAFHLPRRAEDARTLGRVEPRENGATLVPLPPMGLEKNTELCSGLWQAQQVGQSLSLAGWQHRSLPFGAFCLHGC